MSGITTRSVPGVAQAFPDIPVIAADGMSSQLSEHLVGGSASVVFFMRSHDCPVCRAHLRTLQRMEDAGELRGARVIIIAPGVAGAAATVQRFTAFEVLASGEGHRMVGLGRFLALQHSGTFVLDAAGRVLTRRTSALPTSSFSAAEIRAALG